MNFILSDMGISMKTIITPDFNIRFRRILYSFKSSQNEACNLLLKNSTDYYLNTKYKLLDGENYIPLSLSLLNESVGVYNEYFYYIQKNKDSMVKELGALKGYIKAYVNLLDVNTSNKVNAVLRNKQMKIDLLLDSVNEIIPGYFNSYDIGVPGTYGESIIQQKNILDATKSLLIHINDDVGIQNPNSLYVISASYNDVQDDAPFADEIIAGNFDAAYEEDIVGKTKEEIKIIFARYVEYSELLLMYNESYVIVQDRYLEIHPIYEKLTAKIQELQTHVNNSNEEHLTKLYDAFIEEGKLKPWVKSYTDNLIIYLKQSN